MGADMYGQIVFLGKSPGAIRTDKRSFTGVRSDVKMKLGGAFKRLVAFVARLGDFLLGLWSAFLSFLGQFAFVSIAGFAKIIIFRIFFYIMLMKL